VKHACCQEHPGEAEEMLDVTGRDIVYLAMRSRGLLVTAGARRRRGSSRSRRRRRSDRSNEDHPLNDRQLDGGPGIGRIEDQELLGVLGTRR